MQTLKVNPPWVPNQLRYLYIRTCEHFLTKVRDMYKSVKQKMMSSLSTVVCRSVGKAMGMHTVS